MHVALAARDDAHGADDLGVRRLLQHVAARAGLEGCSHIARVVLHREDEDLHARDGLQQLGRRLDPGLARHDDVQHRDVRLGGEGLEERALGRLRFGDDLDVFLGVEHAA